MLSLFVKTTSTPRDNLAQDPNYIVSIDHLRTLPEFPSGDLLPSSMKTTSGNSDQTSSSPQMNTVSQTAPTPSNQTEETPGGFYVETGDPVYHLKGIFLKYIP